MFKLVSVLNPVNPVTALLSPELAAKFESNLGAVKNPKVNAIFKGNLSNVLRDPGLPMFIKELLVDKMGSMERILLNMASRPPETLLLDSCGASHFSRYSAASRALRADLIKRGDAAGVTFSGRNLKLFSWCQAELKETVHPLVHYVLDRLSLEAKVEADAKFARLADISNLLILQIACGDDIADNIQDSSLVPHFVYIPIEDNLRIEKGLPTRADSRSFVQSRRDGIFLDYYDVAVTIWDDIVLQLQDLFGWVWSEIEPEFLSLHEKVMGSLTYSIFMNTQPHAPEITDSAILGNLAPNMMVECFRFLEKSLAIHVAAENFIVLPESDIALCDAIVSQSQLSASLANGVATAPREMRENDISNPIPFALNHAYMKILEEKKQEFGDVFTHFLRENGCPSQFFCHYEDEDSAPSGFDCLNLILIRSELVRSLIPISCGLLSYGCILGDTDYSLAGLSRVVSSLNIFSRDDWRAFSRARLIRSLRHIELIDQFFDKILAETKVEEHLFQQWADDIAGMSRVADTIVDEALRLHAKRYVGSWEDFLCMYLLFKLAFDGTI